MFPNQPSSPLFPSPSLARPSDPVTPLLPLIAVLLATATAGTLYSLSIPTAVTAIRSRMPASALNAARASGGFPAVVPALPYFADKRNVFNQWGVKLGWLWTSLFALAFILVSFFFPPTLASPAAATSAPSSPFVSDPDVPHPWTAPLPPASTISLLTRRSILLSHTRRFALSTLYWYLLTQSTFALPLSHAPSLTHHILIATGAFCTGPGGQACQGRIGEYWKGGHDVSGHTLLLVHASLLLATLGYPTLRASLVPDRPKNLPHSPSVPQWGRERPERGSRVVPSRGMKAAAAGVVGLGLVWWWMLLMTSMYFHTPGEKVSGFLFGLAGWWIGGL